MVQSGTARFTNADDYQAGLGIGGVDLKLVLGSSADFNACLTWLKLGHVHLLSARESVPRIVRIVLPAGPSVCFLSRGSQRSANMGWGGTAINCQRAVAISPAGGSRTNQTFS